MQNNHAISDNLRLFLDTKTTNERAVIKQTIHDGIDFYAKQIEIAKQEEPIANILNDVYASIDDMMETKLKQNSVTPSCRKGCAFCCHINVDVTGDEAEVLIEHAHNKQITIDKDYLKKQLTHDIKTLLKSDVSRCVFLSETNECSVYDVRPSACRTHIVATDPKLCDAKNNEGAQTGRIFIFESELLAAGLMNSSRMGRMPEMILEAMDNRIENEQKHIENGK